MASEVKVEDNDDMIVTVIVVQNECQVCVCVEQPFTYVRWKVFAEVYLELCMYSTMILLRLGMVKQMMRVCYEIESDV
jgi:hypothetical protein